METPAVRPRRNKLALALAFGVLLVAGVVAWFELGRWRGGVYRWLGADFVDHHPLIAATLFVTPLAAFAIAFTLTGAFTRWTGAQLIGEHALLVASAFPFALHERGLAASSSPRQLDTLVIAAATAGQGVRLVALLTAGVMCALALVAMWPRWRREPQVVSLAAILSTSVALDVLAAWDTWSSLLFLQALQGPREGDLAELAAAWQLARAVMLLSALALAVMWARSMRARDGVARATAALVFAPFLLGEVFHATLFVRLQGPVPPPISREGLVPFGPAAQPTSFCAYVAERDGLRYQGHVTPWADSDSLKDALEAESRALSSWTAFTHWAAVWVRDDLRAEGLAAMVQAASAHLDGLVVCGGSGDPPPAAVRSLWWLIGVRLDSVRSGRGAWLQLKDAHGEPGASWSAELEGATTIHLEPGHALTLDGAEPYDVDLLDSTVLKPGSLRIVFHPTSRVDLLLKLIGRVNGGDVELIIAP